jgi:AraC-like DNA-binding protein
MPISTNKIRQSCILPHPLSAEQVRYLPMSTPELDILTEQEIFTLGIDHRVAHQQWSDGPGATHLLFFVTSGSLTSLTDELKVMPGEALVIPSEYPKKLQAGPDGFIGTWFHLATGGRWETWNKIQPHVRSSTQSLLIHAIVDSLLRETLEAINLNREIIRAKADLLTKLFSQEFPSEGHESSPHDRKLFKNLQDLWIKVSTSLDKSWTVHELAHRLHLSESHFHREVLRLHKKTPMEIITGMRMERASALLKTSSDKLSTIASKVGYRTPYAFSNAFLENLGHRPGYFRKQWREKAVD